MHDDRVTLATGPRGGSVARGARDGLLSTPGYAGSSGPYVYDVESAKRIPAVARALGVYGGAVKQLPMDAYRGSEALERPRILDRPDPTNARSWFVQVQVEDYLMNGNAIHFVTSRDASGWPASCAWVPASWVYVMWRPGAAGVTYYVLGNQIPTEDVVHVKRGADRFYPARGVGVVEEHLSTLDRVALEEEYERSSLVNGAVPSVAVITPNPKLSLEEATTAKADWMALMGGANRAPAILPSGTQVVPLGWSPSDAQLTEARRMSLTDIANMFNLDGYWLGAPSASLTYRSPGPMRDELRVNSIEPLLVDLEDVWSYAWLPRGQSVHFDRNPLTRDDLGTTANTMRTLVGVGSPIISVEEARQYLSLPMTSQPDAPTVLSPVDTSTPPDTTGGTTP